MAACPDAAEQPAGLAATFEDDHPVPELGEPRGGREAAEAGPDHDDVSHAGRSRCRKPAGNRGRQPIVTVTTFDVLPVALSSIRKWLAPTLPVLM